MAKQEKLSSTWFVSHPSELAKQNRLFSLNKNASNFLGRIWPTSLDILSPIPSFFSFQLPNLEYLDQKECLFRDGIVSLLWFFKKYPKPSRSFQGRIYVHKSLVQFCPSSWRSKLGHFTLVSLDKVRLKPSRLILHGTLSDEFMDRLSLASKLELVERKLGRLMDSVETVLYLPAKELGGHGDFFKVGAASDLMMQLAASIGTSAISISYSDLMTRSRLQNTAFVDLNNDLICVDNGLSHALMVNGARNLELDQVGRLKRNERIVPLSIHHGYRLSSSVSMSESRRLTGGLTKETLKLVEISDSSANFSMPWPELFSNWADEIVKNRST